MAQYRLKIYGQLVRSSAYAFILVTLVYVLVNADGTTTFDATGLALATLVRSEEELLASRVMFRSARERGGLPATASNVLLTTSKVSSGIAREISDRDGLIHLRAIKNDGVQGVLSMRNDKDVGSVGLKLGNGSSLIDLFGLTDFKRVVYADPFILFIDSVRVLFESEGCAEFCAFFSAPCSFSTNVLVLAPNSGLHDDLSRALSAARAGSTGAECTAGNRPDGLDAEACVLNARFGKRLINARVFRWGQTNQSVDLSTTAGMESGVSRLPMGFAAPHHYFLPRLRWEIPENVCSSLRAIDYSQPKALRPTRWWASALPLSAQWYAVHARLNDDDENDYDFRRYGRDENRFGSHHRYRTWISVLLPGSVLAATLFLMFSSEFVVIDLSEIQESVSASSSALPSMLSVRRLALLTCFAASCTPLPAWCTAAYIVGSNINASGNAGLTVILIAVSQLLWNSTARLLWGSFLLRRTGRLVRPNSHTSHANRDANKPRRSSVRRAIFSTMIVAFAETVFVVVMVAVAVVLPTATVYSRLKLIAISFVIYSVIITVASLKTCRTWLYIT